MRITNYLPLLFLFCTAKICSSQSYFKNVIEINSDVGLSNDSNNIGIYSGFRILSEFIIQNRRFARSRNIAFSFKRFISPSNGFKLQFGHSKYGFNFEGRVRSTNLYIKDYYRTSFFEWGLSYIRKIKIGEITNLLLEPGILYHTNSRTKTENINFFRKDSFSASCYTGLEFPMAGNNFFANVGLQFKLPLERYNHDFDQWPGFYPYFIGIRIGANYQF